jgi:hypothetical protein
MHALPLRLHGIELLTSGRITLPVPETHRSYLRAMRRGEIPLPEVVSAVTYAETRRAKKVLPPEVTAHRVTELFVNGCGLQGIGEHCPAVGRDLAVLM